MRYIGGKAKIAPWLLDIMLKTRTKDQWYIEPFCGGCNTLWQVDSKRIGIDSCEYLIAMWKALQKGWIPPNIIKQEVYDHVRVNKDKYKKEIIGFVGYGTSFSGKFFGGMARGKKNNGLPRDYITEARRTVLTQSATMKEVKFVCTNSLEVKAFPSQSLIYCDPPYANTLGYREKFNTEKFWQWANGLVKQGHKVFISELVAPTDWQCVFQRNKSNDINGSTRIEKLFTKG